MQKQFILFNLDDTLIHCNKYFSQVINQFTNQMGKWFPDVPLEEFRKKQLEIDLAAIDRHGLSSERFPESFVHTYLHFVNETGKKKHEEEIEGLRMLGKSVFEMEVEALPCMHETLEQLKNEGHELYIHTGGDEENQRRKIIQLELAEYFENRVFVSNHKDDEALQKILKKMKFDRDRTWMIGNSLRTDIVPGLIHGINVIYIPAQVEWEYNKIDFSKMDIQPKGAFLKLESLCHVPEAIQKEIYQVT
ncbi:HAD family hydrolase [Ammoniphilus resinae]|uniref:Hydrolase of the HAD superfamily n=1 Tax=Ammoniphilus resinae TaxID=861532 RepID=A0ABS4GXM2_9BACL|nr:HAD hydrolase-like protein [Ammoniphilus resinae]MBP1934615.1 putative hydrolase of the HAD superfamily [Ammoniphilus resinae]